LSGENGKESGETLVSWELLKAQKSDRFGVRKHDLVIAEKCMPWLSFDQVFSKKPCCIKKWMKVRLIIGFINFYFIT
jgi:hypothetical protein